MANIVVIGSANIDRTNYVEEFANKTTGESQNRIIETTVETGGKGANQALAAAVQSNSQCDHVYFIGCIAQDRSLQDIEDSFNFKKRQGYSGVKVDYTCSKFIENEENDGREIFVDRRGNNMMYSRGSNCIKQLTPEVVFSSKTEEILESADVIMIQMKMPSQTVEFVVNDCALKGKTLIIDPTPKENSDLLIKKGLLEKATILTPNEEEAFALALYEEGKYSKDEINKIFKNIANGIITREFVIQIIEKLVKKHPNIIATLGDKGAVYNKNGEPTYVRPFSTKCVDSTGAGDTFNGTFAAAIARGDKLETAIEYAVCASSMKVAYQGAQNGVPTYKETTEYLEEHIRY